ncbi:MAG: pilus assembly protein PilM [Candidatus Poribacteria bacterium]
MKNKRVVGLYVGEESVFAVQLRYRKRARQWEVEKSGSQKIVPEDIAKGESEGKSTEASVALTSTAAAVEKLFSSSGIQKRAVATAITRTDAIVRIFSLPKIDTDSDTLDSVMQYEVDRHLPIPSSQAGFDYQVLRTTQDETRILLAATRRNTLKEHLDFFSQADIEPKLTMPTSLMLFNVLILNFPNLLEAGSQNGGSRKNGVIGAVRLGSSHVDVVVAENGLLCGARSFSFSAGGDEGDLIKELRNTLSSLTQKTVNTLILMAESAAYIRGLQPEVLQSALSIDHCDTKIIDREFAVGLAIGLTDTPSIAKTNLLRPLIEEQEAKKKAETKRRLWRLTPVIALISLLLCSVFLWRQTRITQRRLIEQINVQRSRQLKMEKLANLTERLEGLQRQKLTLNWPQFRYPPLSYRLYQVALAMPRKVWLKEISTIEEPKRQSKRKKEIIKAMSSIIVTGFAHSQEEIDDFIKRLRRQDAFYLVRQQNSEEISVAGEKLLEFQLMLQSE